MARAADATPAAGFSADVAVIAALALAALMGLLWWRVRSLRKDRGAERQRSARSRAVPHRDPGPAQRPQHGQAAGSPPVRALAANGAVPAAPSHALVEGIDLIQQAEFLALLGERDAAVALLGAHLEGANAGDTAVWLKLMQIHRRFGDRHAFERVRPLFSRRFGIEAPTWAQEPAASASLRPVTPPPADDPDPGQTVPAVLLLNVTAARERGQGDKPPSPLG